MSVICPYCLNLGTFMTSKEFYGRDYGTNIYYCKPCDAYVGTHGDSKKPLGTMADLETREMRKRAHLAFDPLWKGQEKQMSRKQAYGWMQRAMNLPSEKAHIAMFDVEQCYELIAKAKTYRGKVALRPSVED